MFLVVIISGNFRVMIAGNGVRRKWVES